MSNSPLALALAQQIHQTLICLGLMGALLWGVIHIIRQVPNVMEALAANRHQNEQDKLAKSRQAQEALQQQRQSLLQLMEKPDWKKPSEQNQTEIWNLFLYKAADQSNAREDHASESTQE